MSGWYVNTILKNSARIRSGLYRESVQESFFQHTNKDVMGLIYQLSDDSLPVSDEVMLNIILTQDESMSTMESNDLYDDLLSIEMTVNRLNREHMFRGLEAKALVLLSTGRTIREIATALEISFLSAWQTVSEACSKVAFCLGDHFTDDGFIVYMIKKYNLDAKDGITLNSLMHRNYVSNRKEIDV
jgi:hypothetical protein